MILKSHELRHGFLTICDNLISFGHIWLMFFAFLRARSMSLPMADLLLTFRLCLVFPWLEASRICSMEAWRYNGSMLLESILIIYSSFVSHDDSIWFSIPDAGPKLSYLVLSYLVIPVRCGDFPEQFKTVGDATLLDKKLRVQKRIENLSFLPFAYLLIITFHFSFFCTFCIFSLVCF